ncbi:hypothetical protein PLANTIT3_90034 [Plantibacter sp. T3]|nr:hypothetical protein PLANTIT3_90034 [Plantibacter sp. T3]
MARDAERPGDPEGGHRTAPRSGWCRRVLRHRLGHRSAQAGVDECATEPGTRRRPRAVRRTAHHLRPRRTTQRAQGHPALIRGLGNRPADPSTTYGRLIGSP